MAKIKLQLHEGEIPVTGKQISFKAPCDCTGIDGIKIEDTVYSLVDTCNNSITQLPNVFIKGSIVTVTLDCETKKAYLQAASNSISKTIQDKNSGEALEVYNCYTKEEYDAIEEKEDNVIYIYPSTFEEDVISGKQVVGKAKESEKQSIADLGSFENKKVSDLSTALLNWVKENEGAFAICKLTANIFDYNSTNVNYLNWDMLYLLRTDVTLKATDKYLVEIVVPYSKESVDLGSVDHFNNYDNCKLKITRIKDNKSYYAILGYLRYLVPEDYSPNKYCLGWQPLISTTGKTLRYNLYKSVSSGAPTTAYLQNNCNIHKVRDANGYKRFTILKEAPLYNFLLKRYDVYIGHTANYSDYNKITTHKAANGQSVHSVVFGDLLETTVNGKTVKYCNSSKINFTNYNIENNGNYAYFYGVELQLENIVMSDTTGQYVGELVCYLHSDDLMYESDYYNDIETYICELYEITE